MSRYGFLTCSDCRVMFWLGKAIYASNGYVNSFKVGGEEDHPNTEQLEMNRVLWKMLAEHTGHTLRVVLDESAAFDHCADFTEIGGEAYGDRTIDQYLEGWNG